MRLSARAATDLDHRSMSDPELSEASQTRVPSDNELEQSLRKEVVRIQKTGVDLTIKAARSASEKRLGLTEGFYKTHETWKDKSKDVITDQVENEADVPSSPVAAKKGPPKSLKRPSPAPEAGARHAPKKQKTEAAGSDEDLSSSLSEEAPARELNRMSRGSCKPKTKRSKAAPATKKPNRKQKSERVEVASDSAEPQLEHPHGKNGHADQSESEMSEVLDEAPKPKKKRGKSSETTASKSKLTRKAPADEDPDQAEIKRLQGWLVKCGIRKVWGKELKPFEKPKAKIKHLRDMLSDAGMNGRYSNEKATQIKEARELAADIEAVQEGDERWGTGEKEAEDGNEDPPARTLVRGSRHLDFLSSDGEETD